MTLVALGLQHHQGPVKLLGVGCWVRDVSGRVLVRCPDCGGIDTVSGVDQRGSVVECFYCETATCSFRRFLRLEGWVPFDVSDAKREHVWRATVEGEAQEEQGICENCGLYASEAAQPCEVRR